MTLSGVSSYCSGSADLVRPANNDQWCFSKAGVGHTANAAAMGTIRVL